MNLINAYVTKILSVEKAQYFAWKVYVEFEDEGGTGREMLYFDTEEEALAVKVGYEFLH